MDKYEKRRHYYGTHGFSTPENISVTRTKVDKKELNYLGLFREYTPLARTTVDWDTNLVLEIEKETGKSKTDFTFIPNIQKVGGWHGSDFNNNGGFRISKQSLQDIVNQMDDVDQLIITAPDSLNQEAFDKIVNEIKESNK